jgi:hypothetical protein
VKRKLHAVEVGTSAEAPVPLPDEVQLRLGEIANVAKEGPPALATAAGLAVLHDAWSTRSTRSSARGAATTSVGKPRATGIRPRGDARRAAGAGQPPARADGRRPGGG